MGIEFGRPDTTWERYQLYTYPILWNGKDTGYRAVVQRDELKSIVGKAYSVVPHEWVKETTENVFKELGLSLVGEQTYKTTLYLYYIAKRTTVRMPGSREEVLCPGIVVVNSLDGSTTFSGRAFVWRQVCENGAMAREMVALWKRRHVGDPISRAVEEISIVARGVLHRANEMIEYYKALAARKLNLEIAKEIASGIPRKYLPEYLREVIEVPSLTLWDVYNDLTASIWHSDITPFRKGQLMEVVHEVLRV